MEFENEFYKKLLYYIPFVRKLNLNGGFWVSPLHSSSILSDMY